MGFHWLDARNKNPFLPWAILSQICSEQLPFLLISLSLSLFRYFTWTQENGMNDILKAFATLVCFTRHLVLLCSSHCSLVLFCSSPYTLVLFCSSPFNIVLLCFVTFQPSSDLLCHLATLLFYSSHIETLFYFIRHLATLFCFVHHTETLFCFALHYDMCKVICIVIENCTVPVRTEHRTYHFHSFTWIEEIVECISWNKLML